MRFYEISEDITRRQFLGGLAALGVAAATGYYPILKNFWAEKSSELKARCNTILANIKKAFLEISPQNNKKVFDYLNTITVNVEPVKYFPHPFSGSAYVMKWSNNVINIDITVFNTAPDNVLYWVIAHEFGHTIDFKNQTGAQREIFADHVANKICKHLGIVSAPVFKWMLNQQQYQETLSRDQAPFWDTHPTLRNRIKAAKEQGVDLSKIDTQNIVSPGGLQQLQHYLT